MKLKTRVREGRVESQMADGLWIDEGPARRLGDPATDGPRPVDAARHRTVIYGLARRDPNPGLLFYGIGIIGAAIIALLVIAMGVAPFIFQ